LAGKFIKVKDTALLKDTKSWKKKLSLLAGKLTLGKKSLRF